MSFQATQYVCNDQSAKFYSSIWSSIVFIIKCDDNKLLYFIFYFMLSEIYGIVQERQAGAYDESE